MTLPNHEWQYALATDDDAIRRVYHGRTIYRSNWDYICHIDDYMAGRIGADELERHVEAVLRSYDVAGQEPPTIVEDVTP